jgi:hypothetical protein
MEAKLQWAWHLNANNDNNCPTTSYPGTFFSNKSFHTSNQIPQYHHLLPFLISLFFLSPCNRSFFRTENSTTTRWENHIRRASWPDQAKNDRAIVTNVYELARMAMMILTQQITPSLARGMYFGAAKGYTGADDWYCTRANPMGGSNRRWTFSLMRAFILECGWAGVLITPPPITG